jgi:glycosyltransferase A (GT-A) superfamily protein (DUF2064 family)
MFSAPWKLATAGAAVLTAILGVFLFMSHLETKQLTAQRNKLIAQIEDPKTGFVARLTQANANVETLQDAVKVQNVKLQEQAVAAESDKRRLAALRVELATAQKETAAMQLRLNHFLATKPQGDTLDARVRDIDKRILEELAR